MGFSARCVMLCCVVGFSARYVMLCCGVDGLAGTELSISHECMYPYCCLCIFIVVYVFLDVYASLLFSMYS